MSELKPCPFCGTHIVEVEVDGNYSWVECGNMECRAAIFPSTEGIEKAISIWNNRPMQCGGSAISSAKQCPFCGWNEIYPKIDDPEILVCEHCHSTSPCWNTRPIENELQDSIDELEDTIDRIRREVRI